ncbi:ash family protein [Escherichia coli]|nr:ash family protein [Escherichia coli]EIE5282042.1 ash family protein [Escherichia coli]HCB7743703.1 ash family protein [Escherichia coli]HCB8533507.1 ash family protein [Escherichia coli]
MALTDKALVTDCLPFSLFSPAFKTGSHALPEQKQNHTEEYQHNKITQDKRRNTNQKGADSQSSRNASVKHTCNTFKPVAVPQVKKNVVIRRELITHQKHPAYADNHQLPGDINSQHSNHISTQHKNRLPALVVSGYISAAPHKTGAGFRSLLTNVAHNRASGFFVRTVSPRLFRTRIMVGRTGPTSVGPGSAFAGTANLVRLATHSFAALDGEFSKLTHVEATPWQTASNSAPALSVFTSAAKSTADFSAQHASHKSCISTCCMSARTLCQTVTVPLFSATWRMISRSCRTLSTSNTTTKQHPEAIPHPYAGGFRTSVTGGSHEER